MGLVKTHHLQHIDQHKEVAVEPIANQCLAKLENTVIFIMSSSVWFVCICSLIMNLVYLWEPLISQCCCALQCFFFFNCLRGRMTEKGENLPSADADTKPRQSQVRSCVASGDKPCNCPSPWATISLPMFVHPFVSHQVARKIAPSIEQHTNCPGVS